MERGAINNYFGDIDLFLMDWILKGKISPDARVLDVGCGEGRNAVYFIQNGQQYVGIDSDDSKIKLVSYLNSQFAESSARFVKSELASFSDPNPFDFIICSRLLHFSESKEEFFNTLSKLSKLLSPSGLLYIAMDSVLDTTLEKDLMDDHIAFPDGKIRFPMTKEIYEKIISLYVEAEPTRTVIYHGDRVQSFLLLRKP